MANGKLVYPTGSGNPTTYNFVNNYDFGHEIGYLETDDYQRTLDGTLKSYLGPKKKTFTLTFTRVLKAQRDKFLELYNLQLAMDLYLDGTNKDASVKIMNAPSTKSESAFLGADELYTFDVYMEEV